MTVELDEIVAEFLSEARENLDVLDGELLALEGSAASSDTVASVFRRVHTIKGACGFMGFPRLEAVAHAAENLLSKLRDGELRPTAEMVTALLEMADTMRGILGRIEGGGDEGTADHAQLIARLVQLQSADADAARAPELSPAPSTTATEPDELRVVSAVDGFVRVDVGLLDKLMNLVGELVLARNQVLQMAPRVADETFAATSQRLNHITTELQSSMMKTRMLPIATILDKLPRVVRDLGRVCGKQVRLQTEGRETELDKTIIEAVKDPLTHLIRNCVDHGIEPPADRQAQGKAAEGSLVIRAYHQSGQMNIEISDDGRGINLPAIRTKAVDRGLVTAEDAARMSDRELQALIFLPGFSTAAQVSNVSGRGVGMDVVKTNIEKIGGLVEVESRAGVGTTFRIKIPLTLAIIPALIVISDGDRFAIPQASLRELVRLEGTRARHGVELVQGAPVYRLRGQLLPLVYLGRALGLGDPPTGSDATVNIVVLEAENRLFGLVVDRIHDAEEIVVKPLAPALKSLGVFAGATIRGDGRVALILDVLELAKQANVTSVKPASRTSEAAAPLPAGPQPQTLLLFVTRDGRRMAVPLSSVARLEEFPPSMLERVAERHVVQYRGEILPLVEIGDLIARRAGTHRAADPPAAGDRVPVVVYSDGQRQVGLMVGQIVDVVEQLVPAASDEGAAGEMAGCLVIGQKVTQLVDLQRLVRLAPASLFPGVAA
ncbi:MAG: two-component system, chemotaxis family, sensor kinase CheA [Myxococcales bacterium]|jgi:two-component system chemotaxis sensor kinase CheA|nr:two-component system, chemotaxis family, sensor kinase CheA [Myxococcales bacterium]